MPLVPLFSLNKFNHGVEGCLDSPFGEEGSDEVADETLERISLERRIKTIVASLCSLEQSSLASHQVGDGA